MQGAIYEYFIANADETPLWAMAESMAASSGRRVGGVASGRSYTIVRADNEDPSWLTQAAPRVSKSRTADEFQDMVTALAEASGWTEGTSTTDQDGGWDSLETLCVHCNEHTSWILRFDSYSMCIVLVPPPFFSFVRYFFPGSARFWPKWRIRQRLPCSFRPRTRGCGSPLPVKLSQR